MPPAERSSKGKRKRKPGIRRLCQGMCYGSPQLTEQDRAWRGEDAPHSSTIPDAERVSRRLISPEQDLEPEPKLNTNRPAKRRKTDEQKSRANKLSTAVNLLEQPGANTPERAQDQHDSQLAAELLALPEGLQRYMQRAGLREPMPVQTRCDLCCLLEASSSPSEPRAA